MIVAGQRLPILIATRPVDFRCGHNALAPIVQTELKLDPHSGVTVVFRSKRGDTLLHRVKSVHQTGGTPTPVVLTSLRGGQEGGTGPLCLLQIGPMSIFSVIPEIRSSSFGITS